MRRDISLLMTVLVVWGCAAPPQRDTLIGERFHAEADVSAPDRVQVPVGGRFVARDPRRPHGVVVGSSRREALLTIPGVRWSAEVRVGSKASLGVSLAAIGENASAQARLVVRDPGSGEPIATATWPLRNRWQRFELAVPAAETARVELSSTGDGPAAWSEIHLEGAPDPPVPRESEHRPNIVVVLIDTLRADHLSVYGYDRPTSPGLDEVATHAFVFEKALSASTWTLPSTASLLSGLLPMQHGVRSFRDRLASDVTTLAEALRDHGYRTVALTDGGFLGFEWGFPQGFDRYDVTPGQAWEPKDVAQIAAAGIEWIEANRFEPYFLLIHTYETHRPYDNPEGFADVFANRPVTGHPPVPREWVYEYRSTTEVTEDPRLEDSVLLYDGEVARTDHYLGQIFDALRDAGQYDRAALLITSDHGEEFMDRGNFEHGLGKVYDPNVRVPLILKLPHQSEGRRIEAPTFGVDVFPTLLEVAGLPALEGLPGRSLKRELELGSSTLDRRLIVEGTNSFPELNENRFRVDGANVSLIYDRVRGHLDGYDTERDPSMLRPLQDLAALGDEKAYLQAALAWLSPGQMAARLPRGLARVAAPANSRVALLGAWSGLSWRPAVEIEERSEVQLDRTLESFLLFDLRPATREWSLLTQADGAESDWAELELRTRGDDGALLWSTADVAPPPFHVVFPTYAFHRPEQVVVSPEARRELEALGYL